MVYLFVIVCLHPSGVVRHFTERQKMRGGKKQDESVSETTLVHLNRRLSDMLVSFGLHSQKQGPDASLPKAEYTTVEPS